MDDRSINSLGDLSTIVGRSILLRESSKADLVVEYNVNYTSSAIVNEVFELYRLVNDSLPSNSCISMDNDS